MKPFRFIGAAFIQHLGSAELIIDQEDAASHRPRFAATVRDALHEIERPYTKKSRRNDRLSLRR